MVNLWDKFQHLTEPIALKFKVALGNMFYALGTNLGTWRYTIHFDVLKYYILIEYIMRFIDLSFKECLLDDIQ